VTLPPVSRCHVTYNSHGISGHMAFRIRGPCISRCARPNKANIESIVALPDCTQAVPVYHVICRHASRCCVHGAAMAKSRRSSMGTYACRIHRAHVMVTPSTARVLRQWCSWATHVAVPLQHRAGSPLPHRQAVPHAPPVREWQLQNFVEGRAAHENHQRETTSKHRTPVPTLTTAGRDRRVAITRT
jgi:hypothetical protein